MHRRLITLVLAAALGVSLITLARASRLPGNNQGYEPAQPMAFSHRLHAGDLRVSCMYCHAGAETSRYAGIPTSSVCMNCHQFVTASLTATAREEEAAQAQNREPQPVVSPELQKLYDALALDADLLPIEGRTPKPIAWTRVHNLPDFVSFDHRAHIAAQVECQRCHGPVDSMERVRQAESLSMGWCVNCHREANRTGIRGRPVHASIDCVTCHY